MTHINMNLSDSQESDFNVSSENYTILNNDSSPTNYTSNGSHHFNFSDEVKAICGDPDLISFHQYKLFEWYIEGVIFVIIAAFGFIGNLLSILVLVTPQLWKHTFNRLLAILAVFDLVFVSITAPIHAFLVFDQNNQVFAFLFPRFLFPMSSISLCASIFMTLAVTVERYWAVCRPTEYRNIDIVEDKCTRVLKYVIPVCIAAVALNIPKFLETIAEYNANEELELDISPLKKNPTYIWLTTILYTVHPLITTELGPIIILTTLNLLIYKTVRDAKRRFNNHNHARSGHGEINLASVLINIVGVFVVCHVPRSILAVIAVTLVNDHVKCVEQYEYYMPPVWLMYAETISHLLLLLNSSINFLIYCMVSTQFKIFMKKAAMRPSNDGPLRQLADMPLAVMTAVPASSVGIPAARFSLISGLTMTSSDAPATNRLGPEDGSDSGTADNEVMDLPTSMSRVGSANNSLQADIEFLYNGYNKIDNAETITISNGCSMESIKLNDHTGYNDGMGNEAVFTEL